MTSMGSEEKSPRKLRSSLDTYDDRKTKKREDQRQKLNSFYQNLRDAGTIFNPTASQVSPN